MQLTYEQFQHIKYLPHVIAVSAAIVIVRSRARNKAVSRFGTATLFLSAFVFVQSLLFPMWVWFVDHCVGIRDEALDVVLKHLHWIGPLAVLALVLSLFQPRIRLIGVLFSTSFVFFMALVVLLN